MVWNDFWSEAGVLAGSTGPADAPDFVDPVVSQKVYFCKMYSM